MFKRVFLVALSVLLLFSVSGCSAIFMNTYHSEQEFQGNEEIGLDSNLQVVQNYNELRRLVFNMMNNHIESEEFVFSGYTGNAVTDIASVCNAVNTESAYGAYCVDYITYDLRQIVSSYEAQVNISYLYTVEELDSLRTTSDMKGVAELLVEGLSQEQPKLVVRVNNGVSDQEAVLNYINDTIRNNPMAISYVPNISVKLYEGNTSQKIYDIGIQYDGNCDNATRLKEIAAAIKNIVSVLDTSSVDVTLLDAAMYLSDECRFAKEYGSTAFDALVSHTADSQGFAIAFKALCDALEIECMVVSGRMDKQEHYWNIVRINDAYYHMDAALVTDLGAEATLFLKDSEKQVNCWWDQSAYPDCEGNLSYEDVISINK